MVGLLYHLAAVYLNWKLHYINCIFKMFPSCVVSSGCNKEDSCIVFVDYHFEKFLHLLEIARCLLTSANEVVNEDESLYVSTVLESLCKPYLFNDIIDIDADFVSIVACELCTTLRCAVWSSP